MAERACILYKETRINTDFGSSPLGSNVINVRLPSHRSSVTFQPRRRSVHIRPSSSSSQHGGATTTEKQRDIEAIFAYNSLAKAASIYFRRGGASPRSILYRIVEDWEVLSIQAADVVKGPEDGISALDRGHAAPVLRFHFPDKIRENCVALADVPNKDEVIVYVMTVANTIYTLRLKGDLLRNGGGGATARAGRGGGIGIGNLKEAEYCKTYHPTVFALHSPHFLVAIDHERLLVSLQDGVLLRLDRGEEEDDATESTYTEKTFSDATYVSLIKNKLPWMSSGISRYQGANVSHSAAISTAIFAPYINSHDDDDPMGGFPLRDRKNTLLFTVSINHTLKIWSLEKGMLLQAYDLMNQPSANTNIKTILHPAPAQLLAIIETPYAEDQLFYLVTYSSASNGKFKFWVGYKDTAGRFTRLEDLYPDKTFDAMPPTPNSVWIISEFRITPVVPDDPNTFNMWILWKSNTSFKIQNLQFDIKKIPAPWTDWATSTTDSLHAFPSKPPPSSTTGDVTDAWMEWIFYPERFPESVIEAALEIYEQHFSRGLNLKVNRSSPIKARVGKIVASAVEFQKNKDGSSNLERYRHEVGLQWDRFVRICVELDRQRGEALSLVADPELGYIWAVNADGITVLRECTETEMLVHNVNASPKMYNHLTDRTDAALGTGLRELKDVMLVLKVAAELTHSLSTEDLEQCTIALKEEVVQDPMFAVIDRMWGLLERCISMKVPRHVMDKIDNALDVLKNPAVTIKSILASVFVPRLKDGAGQLTEMGAKMVAKGTQEVVHVNYTILYNLAFLVTTATFPDRQEKGMAGGENIYVEIINQLKEYEILKWMAKEAIREPTPEDALAASLSGIRVSDGVPSPEPVIKSGPILQLMLPEDVFSTEFSVTASIRNFIAHLDLSAERGKIDVANFLLQSDALNLAMEFSQHLPSTYWGAYVRGRILLRNKDWTQAALKLKRAATGLGFAGAQKLAEEMPETVGGEGEVTSFGNGLALYYVHVARLFEEVEQWGVVVEFCRAALLTLADKANDESLKMGILSKMFQACLNISSFDEAYLTLMQYNNKTLQLSALISLLDAMVEQGQGLRLTTYPFIDLQDEVDSALLQRCHTIIDVTASPPFHQVLYAWRIQRGDFRGAASILHQRLQRLKTASVGHHHGAAAAPGVGMGADHPEARNVTDGFLALLNVLGCLDEDQAWVLSENRTDAENLGGGEEGSEPGTEKKRARKGESWEGVGKGGVSGPRRRQVVTRKEVEEEYRREVERQAAFMYGAFFV
ncbi:nucleoporin Nup120/160-domain-containing protein [Kalaharituber pfeilii]|nr:nucleoporin Nup120/160-domain-containing protein [Kalaharituber pfeilii]